MWWYYITELSFYWGLIFSQFIDVRRKDFWVMFVHHLTTILLMCFSWTCNFFKVGTLVLLLHDCADIFLETAKLLKYSGIKKGSELFFGGFAITWIITRLGIFPSWIIYSVAVEAPLHMEYFPAYYIFNALLSILLVKQYQLGPYLMIFFSFDYDFLGSQCWLVLLHHQSCFSSTIFQCQYSQRCT